MKKFLIKLLISATSGLLGKILLILFCLSAGYAGSKIPIVADNDILKGMAAVISFILLMLTVLLTLGLLVYFTDILEWLSYQKESKKEELRLENENLKLKREIIELEKQTEK